MSELVSGAEFPASWENAGNFVHSGPLSAINGSEFVSNISVLKGKFPTHPNREIISA
jgi:hypothetical protein